MYRVAVSRLLTAIRRRGQRDFGVRFHQRQHDAQQSQRRSLTVASHRSVASSIPAAATTNLENHRTVEVDRKDSIDEQTRRKMLAHALATNRARTVCEKNTHQNRKQNRKPRRDDVEEEQQAMRRVGRQRRLAANAVLALGRQRYAFVWQRLCASTKFNSAAA